MRSHRRSLIAAGLVGLVLLYPVLDDALGARLLVRLIPLGIFIVLAIGLNVVVGYAGLLDLGYAAFFAIGAYTVALLSSRSSPLFDGPGPLDFWSALVVAVLVAAAFGVILGAPTLRMRSDYLALATLAFGEIVPLVVRNVKELTGGDRGVAPIAVPSVPGMQFGISSEPWFFLTVAVVLLAIVASERLRRSRVGRAWAAVREDELAASSSGIDPPRTKLLAFALGASFSGFGGAIWSSYLQFVTPEMFDYSISVFLLAAVIVGGMGNTWGVLVGALLLGGFDRALAETVEDVVQGAGGLLQLPELLAFDVTRWRTFMYGAALIVAMRLRPQGLLPVSHVRRDGRGPRVATTATTATAAPDTVFAGQGERLIEARDLHVDLGTVPALRGISLAVDRGEVVALIGTNGAGKTTTLRAIMGLVLLAAGRIDMDGRDLSNVPAFERARLGIAYVPEGRSLHPDMTVRENLALGAHARIGSLSNADLERVLALFPPLSGRLGQLAGTLSGGEQQMVAIARALMSRPRLLLLDEPSMSLAPLLVRALARTIEEIARQGASVLLVEQNAQLALTTASRAYVLEAGRVVVAGPSSRLRNDARVWHAYLGSER